MSNFERTMKFVLRWEGGSRITRDPDDPGGTTRFGISKRANPTVNIETLTRERALEIYRKKYWDRLGCDKMQWPMCLVVMDYGLHSGVKTVRSLRSNLAQVVASERSPRSRAYRLNAARMAFLLRIAERRKKSRKYMRGWMNRVSAVNQEIEKG